MRLKQTILLGTLFLLAIPGRAQQVPGKESFDMIDLAYPGLEKVKTAVQANRYTEAAAFLLQYYRDKLGSKPPDFSNLETPVDISKPLDTKSMEIADNALLHRFKTQEAYGFFDFGEDINWQLWPVKDNEVRWQLHRVKWWLTMALAYRQTKNEAYAKEWQLQFGDWVKKNPLGLSADNDRYAWRALEISDRIQSLVPTLSIFINSPDITAAFLLEFMKNYNQQVNYLSKNYAAEGNHRLFEAQRVLFAGASFPEFKNAATWRKHAIDILNTEIKKQVYADGVQYELSPVYHAATIDIFVKALNGARKAQLENEFPASFKQTVEKMAMAFINITFPDYNQPMYGDSWWREKSFRMQQFKSWSDIFPNNKFIRYFATDGKEGLQPHWLSNALKVAGFYTFRNGWDSTATILMLKASPPGEFHAQPDNGTFELWANGRNFTPDAGCYVYSGDAEIMKQRDWYRQTRVHSTLTLDDQNMVITKAVQNKWQTSKTLDLLTYTNPSYTNLNHQRSILFIDQKYFLIIDRAIGTAKGMLGTHFVLKEDSNPVLEKNLNKVYTTYADGNNLLIQNLNTDPVTLRPEAGKVSYQYKKEMTRPAFVFEKNKRADSPQTFITLLCPYNSNTVPEITLKEKPDNNYNTGRIHLDLTINGVTKNINQRL